MIWHSSTSKEILTELQSDINTGLSSEQVAQKQTEFGKNKFTEKRKVTFFERFVSQLKDTMVIILMLAAAVSVAVTILEGHNDWIEPLVIVAIILLNAFLGVIQEAKAESALEALENMAAPTARVIRNGVDERIDATELVSGDIIILDAGDFIPADARLLESFSLKCDESMLTGESVSADKDAGIICPDIASLGDRANVVYSGCSVAYGHCKAVVTETGMNTEMGKIATILKGTEDAVTPLQVKLAQLGKTLGFLALGVCLIIFAYGLIIKLGWLDMFMTAISLAVAAIPEGLPAIVTIVLAIGVQRMVKKNAIIRRLPAVETLGSASVICSDKTGTLTQNRMTLVKAYVGGKIEDIEGNPSEELKSMLRLGALCCDGDVTIDEKGSEHHRGDPTETAIVAAALNLLNTDKQTLDNEYPRMAEIPFDSERKLMTTVVMVNERPIAIVKGGSDIIMDRCPGIDREGAENANKEMASGALRVLGIAYKELESVPSNPTSEELEHDLKFVGLVGMIDPPREEAKLSIMECKAAGIRTIMITGDHVLTASAIAKQLGILEDGDVAMTGAELSNLSEEELLERLEHVCVYARVSPEDKIRIVRAWQAKGQVVAMTGDGVNDAPALKAADIGCAMGITGTDVAKGAAAMTLTDDNFATIVTAVKEGRGIYSNIKKAVQFLLSCNLGEIVAVFIGLIIFKAPILTPILLLWVNLVTDSLPALALGMEPVEDDVMQQKPRKKDESIFANGVGISVAWQGILIGVVTICSFYFGHKFDLSNVATEDNWIYARTFAFAVLALSQLFHAMTCRSQNSLFKAGWFKNKWMIGAFVVSALLMAVVLFVAPIGQIFGVAQLKAEHVLEVVGFAIIPFVLIEIIKLTKWVISKKK